MIRHSLPVLFLLGVMCFSHIHHGSIAADAVRYAYIAYHIVVSGDGISLYDARTESLYVNKPPLLFWLLAVCYKLFGFSTFIGIDFTPNSRTVSAKSMRSSIVSPMPMIPPEHTSIPSSSAWRIVSIFSSIVWDVQRVEK